MPEGLALELAREAIWVTIQLAAPIMLVALVVGLIISLVQALTQVQEMTLSFVPKILAIFVSLLLFLPFMAATLSTFTRRITDHIAGLG